VKRRRPPATDSLSAQMSRRPGSTVAGTRADAQSAAVVLALLAANLIAGKRARATHG